MRRHISVLLLVALFSQPCWSAAQASPKAPQPVLQSTVVAQASHFAFPIRPVIQHRRPPRRPSPDYANAARYARMIPRPRQPLVSESLTKPIDLVKLAAGRRFLTATRSAKAALSGPGAAITPSTTGMWPWWTFDTRSVPGIGKALVNVTNLNFLITADDMDVSEGGIDLAFRRVYNSQSLHDQNNDDNSTPSVFGNKWTNNLDAHLGWSQIDQTDGTVSVYTGTGNREDFVCATNIQQTCTSETPGAQDILGSISINNGVACQFQLTEKVGVAYIFTAPYSACGKLPGAYGRLVTIWGRNNIDYLTLSYSWSPDASNPENLSRIVVTHYPDASSFTLNFGQISGTSITELMSVVRPDGNSIDYRYNNTGGLTGVDKPFGNPVLPVTETIPTQWPDGTPIPLGNLPETYDIEGAGLFEACGPRAAIGALPPNNGANDGACVDFDYVSNTNQLTDWYTRGVLNPYPEDDVSYSNIQSGPSTGFVQWDDAAFFSNNQGSLCNPFSEAGMSDADQHATSWCYDTNGRVVEIASAVSATQTLYSSQTWDSNNDLTSVTDSRGNTTNIAYDPSGNPVEISLPKQSINPPGQNLRPTYLIDYDQYNNMTYYCDPANNPNNAWNPSQSDTLCESSGGQYSQFSYTSDNVEPFRCMTTVTTPRGYHWTYTYSGTVGACGIGLPTTITGDQIQQADGSNRTPTQAYSYTTSGLLATYTPTGSQNNLWQISYTTGGMNRVRSVEDADSDTSYACYNPNGTIFFTETPQQYQMDQSQSCPSPAHIAGGAAPPKYADARAYDPDGNVATVFRYHGCWGLNGYGSFPVCPAVTPAPTNCYKASVPDGATCNFYDGLERLVEVKQPYDTTSDIYTAPWITRYLYDLSEGGTQQFYDQTFSAYGNLFEVEERLPSTPTVATTPAPGSVANPINQPVSAYAYDGLDRPVSVYAAMGTPSPAPTAYSKETFTWDTSPLDSNVSGMLGKECNSASPQQCQQFDYTADGQLKNFQSNDGSAAARTYQVDGDGRTTQVSSGSFTNPQQYQYDPDGNVTQSTDVSNNSVAQNSAVLTYHWYLDRMQSSLDVASGAFNQTGFLSYSYRADGLLKTLAINDASLGSTIAHHGTTTVSYAYTPAGRLSTRSESGVDVDPSPLPTMSATYTNLGLLQNMTYPQTKLTSFAFSVENELVQVSDQNCAPWNLYYYTVRGESSSGQLCNASGGAQPFANLYSNGLPLTGGHGVTWNSLMSVLENAWSTVYLQSTWTYSNAGRLKSEAEPYPVWSPAATIATTRTYDAEGHLDVTTFASPAPSPSVWPYSQVTWGPDGHPALIGTSQNGNAVKNERLHWSGDQLLFTTHDSGGNAVLDDVKIDLQGDILPGDTYSGLTFYDRGPGGMILGCHNYTGTSYMGFSNAGWGGTGLPPCSENLSPKAKMPTSTVWSGSPYSTLSGAPRIGTGGTLGMMRPDGITDGYDTIQGARAFDSTTGLWTTPDTAPADIYNPASLKSYLWNGNNPLNSIDPSGNNTLLMGFADSNRNFFGEQYHAFGILVDDSGNILQIYSFGPENGWLNNEYHDVEYAKMITNGGLWDNSLAVVAGCRGVCPWQAKLTKAYFGFQNNNTGYGIATSDTALAYTLMEAGLPSGLPSWAPYAWGWIPGGHTCSGTSPDAGPWGCTPYLPEFISRTNNVSYLGLGPGLTQMIYALYGGAFPTSVPIACNWDWTCILQY